MPIRQIDKKTLEYFYSLDIKEDGKIFCPCLAGVHGKYCHHITEAINFLKFLENKNSETVDPSSDDEVIPF